jgi:hypothetical protein
MYGARSGKVVRRVSSLASPMLVSKAVVRALLAKLKSFVRILVLFYYTVNFTTYSSKVDYTILTLVPRQDTTL